MGMINRIVLAKSATIESNMPDLKLVKSDTMEKMPASDALASPPPIPKNLKWVNYTIDSISSISK
jgi:hypothetical protein